MSGEVGISATAEGAWSLPEEETEAETEAAQSAAIAAEGA